MGVHSEIIIMKAFIFATVLAVAAAVPLEDTEEVKAAKAEFAAKFAAAEAGELADLQAAQIPTAYLADLEDVTKAKEEFMAVFNAYKAGEIPLPVAPVHEVAPVQNAYLADVPEVTEAKAAFMKVFNAYKAGEIPLPEAPVHEVKPVVATPAVAPVAVAAPYWNNYYGAYPAYAHAAYAGAYAYPGAYAYAHPYAAYHGLGYALPTVTVAKAE